MPIPKNAEIVKFENGETFEFQGQTFNINEFMRIEHPHNNYYHAVLATSAFCNIFIRIPNIDDDYDVWKDDTLIVEFIVS